ncbi:MAG: N-acetyltransferase [Acidobacteriota bacterium]|nr:N-acetyltransferase [Acidobacteriota bacterium]
MTIRDADPLRDAAGCAAIYGHYVRETAVSFEEQAPGERAMALRMESIVERFPWLVAELADSPEGAGATAAPRGLAGFAHAAPHRERAAYRWSVDVTVYVADGARRRGVGRALYGALLPMLAAQGFHAACAGITLPNDASVALHESFGFELVGVHREIGFKAGAWRDVGWWQAMLAAADRNHVPPAEPRGPRPYEARSVT